ncbi:HNH endonuclease signature motif containing protein [Mycolicibacterium neworleansense]|uniref:REP13E12 repeat protein n=1 Tax=Mycolicibacterium neworleansense TaxID=146018 RepID=A0A0H5RWN7_9MYCO|nr:HNH endonuclease signature motif containing protein [Mycolicibacterium neworleansense]MCV7362820.1 HNH endonuclease [Mycolicibacterium neworleansense]CRZ18540.1 REP13E12 repeat protein [Mycolicibacterium neworleansense]
MGTATLDRQHLLAAYEAYEAAAATIAAVSHDVLTLTDLQWIATRRERVARAQVTVDHAIIVRIADQITPQTTGGNSMRDILVHSLRISKAEAQARLDDAVALGPRRAMNGEPLAPKLPTTAATQARGEIGVAHVRVIRKFFKQLPAGVSAESRDSAEELLGRTAARLTPDELRQVADRLRVTIDQDGPEPHENVAARNRGLVFGKQDSSGLTEVRGHIDAECRAIWDAVNAKMAAPGMCNPDDETLCVDAEPDDETVKRDLRTKAQRNHDAFKAAGREILGSGKLGQHRGLPVTVVVTTTLDQITSGEGWAVTGGGSLLPMADVLRLASHAYHYLCIYDSHTQVPLYLGRTKRIASTGQRLALFAMEGGCSRPGCTAPAYWSQVHHRDRDWADGGRTDIDELTLACPPCHRLLTSKGWRTRTGKDGRTEWIPPPILLTGSAAG